MNDFSEYTDANESISAPTEVFAEFLSAVMMKDYKTALKYCQMILTYEPSNSTAKEFYPLIVDKLRVIDKEANSIDNSSSTSESSDSLSSSSESIPKISTYSIQTTTSFEENGSSNGNVDKELNTNTVADDVNCNLKTGVTSSNRLESMKLKKLSTVNEYQEHKSVSEEVKFIRKSFNSKTLVPKNSPSVVNKKQMRTNIKYIKNYSGTLHSSEKPMVTAIENFQKLSHPLGSKSRIKKTELSKTHCKPSTSAG